ncbi:MAG: putative nucleotide-diphospho-sugar transferase [Cyanobacteriota bacterium]|nr:putative nucleotide-diphospho-sugar transferase [Cyanobacteriota bacterium]
MDTLEKFDVMKKGFITVLTGVYSFQDCVHFLTSVRKFHKEPIIILIDRVPKFLYPLLKAPGNIILKSAPGNDNPVLASRLAKLALYQESPFEQTIYMDADICLLTNIDEVFQYLNEVDFLVTEDVQPAIAKASNLLRVKQQILPTLQSVGLPLKENSIQYNGGFIAFRKSNKNEIFFKSFKKNFDLVAANQDVLLLRDQGAFAAAMVEVEPLVKVLPPTYNFLDKWKEVYQVNEPIKVMHATYPYRPQYAKNITRTLYTRIFDKVAKYLLPNQVKNPWRKR